MMALPPQRRYVRAVPPWQILFVVAIAAGALLGALASVFARRRAETSLAALRERARQDRLTFGEPLGRTQRRELTRAYKDMKYSGLSAEGIGTTAVAGSVLAVTLVLIVAGAAYVTERWDGTTWPWIEQKRPSLAAVEAMAARTLQRDVRCVEANGERLYRCGDPEEGLNRVLRLTEDGDRLVVER